ncbi:MAG: SEC-C metal-binding domain-containing protein [Rhodoferax sp.]
MKETEVFSELQALCTSPGYIHAIAYICYRDNMIAYKQEMKADDMQKLFRSERLIRTEITTLLGLIVQSQIDYTLPKHEVIDSYIERTDFLMSELHKAMGQEMMFGLVADNADPPSGKALSRGAVLREPIFYGGESAYSFQYRDFSPRKYQRDDNWLHEHMGFRIQSAQLVTRAMGDLQNTKLMRTQRAMDKDRPDSWTLLPGFIQTPEELAATSGVALDEVRAVLDAFTLNSRNDQFTTVSEFNSLSGMPLIPMPDGNVLLFQYYSIVEALYESPFYWMGQDKAYLAKAFTNRGAFTEEFAAARLETVFGVANVRSNIDLVQGKSRVGEIDVMVSFGDRLIIVQTKSKRLTLEARKGNDGHIRDDFRKAIQDSYHQGLLCAKHILTSDCKLYGADKNEVVLRWQPKEIFLLNVVADHYPALSFQSSQFLQFETTDVIREPFIMDVFLLDAMTEMLETPLRLLGYISQRVRHLDKLHMSHELTALSYHLKQNMWLDGDMDFVMLGDDIAVDLDLAMTVRRDGVAGARTPDGILTRFVGTFFEHLIQQIEQRADPPCIELGFLLLTLGEDTCRTINTALETITKATRSDGMAHDFTIGIGAAGEGITFYCLPGSAHEAAERLRTHCYRRKYAQKASKWFGLCIDINAHVQLGVALSFPWEKSAEMDANTAGMRQGFDPRRLGTQKPSINQVKVGRNDPCPCGSGLKYKKCHLLQREG